MIKRLRHIAGRFVFYLKNDFDNCENKCAVLIYHRVCELETDPQLLCVSPSNFESQLTFLKKTHAVISLQDAINHIENKKAFPKKCVVITFDDGYVDNFNFALPILEKHATPATIFVTSGLVGTQLEYWWDELERIFLLLPPHKTLELKIADSHYSWEIKNDDDARKTYTELHPKLKHLCENERNAIIDELFLWAGKSRSEIRETHRSLNHSEVLALSKSSVIEIGSHTVTHPCLRFESDKKQLLQIVDSKQQLTTLLCKEIQSFSYPFGGRKDFSDVTKKMVIDAGYNCGIANYPDLTTRTTDRFAIPRFLVRNWDQATFQTFMASLYTKKPGLWDLVKRKCSL